MFPLLLPERNSVVKQIEAEIKQRVSLCPQAQKFKIGEETLMWKAKMIFSLEKDKKLVFKI